MPSKIFEVEGIGPVTITKRRSARHIRLSINAKHQVKVSLPMYVPYAAGIKFLNGKHDWIKKHLSTKPSTTFSDGARVGKSYRLRIVHSQASTSRAVIRGQEIFVYDNGHSPAKFKETVERACEKALRADAKKLLGIRLEQLAKKYGYSYSSVSIKKLTSRWGSCGSDKRIALSLYLIQLPWHLIDYVILHELNHTVHMHHQKPFWDQMVRLMPSAKAYRAELKKYRPVILPASS